jgi:hypothetical protein
MKKEGEWKKTKVVEYYPTPTGAKFHNSPAQYKCIMGPVGSGKSVACVMELLRKSQEQEPQEDGVRRTRWAIVRNTYADLKTTTLETFQDWIPESWCHISTSHAPMDGVLRLDLPDGTKVESTFWFMALDNPEDVRKLKSLEITGAWLNEARYINKAIMSVAVERSGRYPSMRDGGPTWDGIICDTNPPSNSHWYYDFAEKLKPDDWDFFRQPPAVLRDKFNRPYVNTEGNSLLGIPKAENIDRLKGKEKYYKKQLVTKNEREIKVDLEAQYGFLHSGKPVWPQFRETLHVSKDKLDIYRGMPIIIGTDNGRTPATLVCQMTPFGQLRVLREIHKLDTGAPNFIKQYVKPLLDLEFSGQPRTNYCDPACNQKAQTSELTVLDVWNKNGIHSVEAPCSNRLQPRLDAVENLLTRLVVRDDVGGEPAILIDPSCTFLIESLNGGYHLELEKSDGCDEFKEVPKKDKYSHICDALQYVCIAHDDDYAAVIEEYTDSPDLEVVVDKKVVW